MPCTCFITASLTKNCWSFIWYLIVDPILVLLKPSANPGSAGVHGKPHCQRCLKYLIVKRILLHIKPADIPWVLKYLTFFSYSGSFSLVRAICPNVIKNCLNHGGAILHIFFRITQHSYSRLEHQQNITLAMNVWESVIFSTILILFSIEEIARPTKKIFKTWAENWGMLFNTKKCYFLSVS